MADDSEILVDEAPSKKRNLLIFIIVGVLLLGAGGAAGYFIFSDNGESSASSTSDPNAVAEIEQAHYVVLPQPFVFNVTGDRRNRLVQISVQLMVRGETNMDTASKHLPLIRSTLLGTFGAATAEELQSPQGRKELRELSTQAVQAVMEKILEEPVIERVLFTGFVMQ